jgi:hypothetical protein
MTSLENSDERKLAKKEYEALKKHLGDMLLEHNAQEENPEDWAYYSRKFEEAREKLKRQL